MVGCALIQNFKNEEMKISKYIIALFAIYVFTGCAKTEEFNNTETNVGQSRVTIFPTLELKGNDYMAIPVGTTFTDPGAIAKEGTADIQFTVTGSVNTATAGVYRLVYTAVNKDGFATSTNRYVAVYATQASAASNDLSGTYFRAATAQTSTWTKIAPGVYKVLNPGGAAAGTGLVVVAFNPTGYSIKIPSQIGNDGNTSASSDEVYTNSTPATYTWRYLNPAANYGTGLRTFVKQ
jgi:hypothetical protein